MRLGDFETRVQPFHPHPIARHRRRDVHLGANPVQRAAGNPQLRRDLRAGPRPDVLVELGAFESGHGGCVRMLESALAFDELCQ